MTCSNKTLNSSTEFKDTLSFSLMGHLHLWLPGIFYWKGSLSLGFNVAKQIVKGNFLPHAETWPSGVIIWLLKYLRLL